MKTGRQIGRLGKASIRWKLTLIIMLTCSIALLPALAGFIAYELIRFRSATVRELSTVAEVIGADSTAALEAVSRQSVDVVPMDVHMPRMDGFEATRLIRERENQSGAHLPIIALTAHAMTGDRQRCLEVGMDDYLSKPIRPQELLEGVDNLLTQNVERGT